MKKLSNRIIIIVIAIVVAISIYSYQTGWNPLPHLDKYWIWRSEIGNDDFEISFTKITTKEDVPESVLDNIKQLNADNNLERGLWCFNPEFFEVDKFYFMICGGSSYPDKYDVKITDYKHEYYNPNIRRSDEQHIFSNLSCQISVEEMAANSYDYSEGIKYPVVILVINERHADKIQLKVVTRSGSYFTPKSNFPK